MVDALLEKAKDYLPPDRLDLISHAYDYAADAHEGQVRRSGEPFIIHPLQTALYLADLRLDANALAAALLHDVVEDCDVCLEEIEDEFGREIAGMVDGVTKLTKAEVDAEEGRNRFLLNGSEVDLEQAASLRKMLVTMAEDIRVVLIKLADRLHNMRTLRRACPQGGAAPLQRKPWRFSLLWRIVSGFGRLSGVWKTWRSST